MAKMKVHELAKELDIQSKDILAFLNDKGVEAKVAQSSVDDDAAALVRKKFGAAPVAAPIMTPAAKAEEEPKKKKKIIFVSNPQNSNISGQRPNNGNGGNRPAGGNQPSNTGNRPQNNNRPQGRNNNNRPQNRPVQEAPHKIIRPLTAPSMPENVQQERRPMNNVQNAQPRQMSSTNTQNTTPRTPEVRSADNRAQGTNQNNRSQAPAQPRYQNQGSGQGYNHGNSQGNQQTRNYQQNGGQGQNRNTDARAGRGERTYQQGNYQQGNRPGGQQGDRPVRPNDGRRPEGGNRPNNQGYQNDRRNAGPGTGGGRPGSSDGRFERGNDRPDNRFAGKGTQSKSTPTEGIGKDTSKHREEEKRRINQEKDKRSKRDFIYEDESAKANTKRKVGAFIKPEKKAAEVQEEQIKVIVLPETLTIKELADKMKIQPSAIIKKLFLLGQIVNVNTEISYEDAENIAIDYDIICEQEVKVDIIEELLKEDDENADELIKRAPIICVMGHVDHGKTSLLDAIRKTHVTERESGGITQHIGAYTVTIHDQKITFLDTPGHEAFTAMRMRGANATDIAILVVAADDGVMPQTVEAISHAKAAGIEIIVAVNKIDKPSANIDRVKQEMTEYELIPSDWGGTTEYVPVSAKSGEGIETLLETIVLTSEIMELKANPNRQARGLVIEAELDKGRGPVATVLVQKGTLHVGDFISAGASHGKVRAMVDDKGRRVKEALPSTPVEILGLSDVPSAGEIFISHESDKVAKNYAETYQAQNKVKMLEDTKAKMSLDDLFTQIQAGNLKDLNIIVKADVQGSVEAVKQSLLKLSNEEVVVKCIHGGVGAINESDVSLASTSSAIIIGFNVRPDATAKASAEREGVDIRLYKVIYQAIEDIEAAMKGMLDPVFEEKVLGHAEIRQIFKASALGNIAGSYVLDGMFQRNCKVRINRGEEQIYEGELASLKRFKDDVKEVKAGYECGLVFEGFDQVQELDIVEAYIMVEVPR